MTGWAGGGKGRRKGKSDTVPQYHDFIFSTALNQTWANQRRGKRVSGSGVAQQGWRSRLAAQRQPRVPSIDTGRVNSPVGSCFLAIADSLPLALHHNHVSLHTTSQTLSIAPPLIFPSCSRPCPLKEPRTRKSAEGGNSLWPSSARPCTNLSPTNPSFTPTARIISSGRVRRPNHNRYQNSVTDFLQGGISLHKPWKADIP